MTPESLVVIRAAESGVRASDVRGPSRCRRVVRVRAWIAAELRSTWGLSYPKIGRILGGRHHTTIMYLLGVIGPRKHRKKRDRRGPVLYDTQSFS